MHVYKDSPAAARNADWDALLQALSALKRGDTSVRLPTGRPGVRSQVAEVFNELAERNATISAELKQLRRIKRKNGRDADPNVIEAEAASRAALNGEAGTVLAALNALRNGDSSARLPVEWSGAAGRIAETFNDVVALNVRLAGEIQRLARVVGREGKLKHRASIGAANGFWRDSAECINTLVDDLVQPTAEVSRVIESVVQGDLTKTMPLEIDGRPLEGAHLRNAKTVNRMIDQLALFAAEVTRVAREIADEGKLGGQVKVAGVAGTWKSLTDSVNTMAKNLTDRLRNIAEVTTAVAVGDLSKKITVEVKGEILELKNTTNAMVDQLRSFASEVTRVAREVGTEGMLGGQARVEGVSGTWKDLTDSVNFMAGNLTSQVRNIAEVTKAVAAGDLSKKITVNVKGEILELKDAVNTMVDQLRSFAAEVTRVAREVGTEGKLGGQADVRGVSGTWKDLTESVNSMAGNLTGQVRNIAEVTKAVAAGDLRKKITVDVKGEILELKNIVNTMVDQLRSFAAEVTRVAREVGTEGKLGGQADVQGVSGTWKDLTENVNFMASNLTGQVRNIAEVTKAVAAGDLGKKITVDVKGEILELKNTINTMVDQLSSFAAEVTRVAREVGTEGILGGQAEVKGIAGTWKDLTESVNSMAGNLTGQVRNIAEVTKAVAAGDLSKKITVNVKGEILDLKITVNTMVDQLSSFAAEVTRVAREVGTEGRLGGQAEVKGVGGTWKDLTESVNSMASNLTVQLRDVSKVSTAIAMGDLTQTITVDVRGEILQIKNVINTMVDQLRSFASEVTRVAREVGTEGKLGGQAQVQGVSGTWKDLTESVNFMAGNLTGQVRNIAEVTTAVAGGDLSKKITVDVKGEILELKNTVNTMVDQLRSFAAEVTRVAREVGTEGMLGGQAKVEGVSGTWKDLTDSVNFMASNLTSQVRGIAKVVTAVANGDLKQKLTVEAKGEIAALAETINSMTDTLATFADQVTGVAREVGVEGQLGGQAKVPGAAGRWKGLTENVNQLAANLTTQVRAIAEVATAVTQGDLTRSITVQAQGEVAELKDNINEMIRNLKDTTQKNTETDWLKTNLAKFSRMLQGQKDLVAVGQMILSELAPVVGAQQAEFYVLDGSGQTPRLKLIASYASEGQGVHGKELDLGQGLVGQCAVDKQPILLTRSTMNDVRVVSGLSKATPQTILVLPVVFEGYVKGVVELASLDLFSSSQHMFLDQLMESIGIVINTIEANMRTENLLQQSQSLAEALQSRQQQLTATNQELQEKAMLLAHQNQEVERKNREVEQARQALEEKARQLALTSKYKSEFLANMSHELRTPLNSLLILSDQLSKNSEGNLNDKQVEFARTIHSSGNDLLMLINDILDLSKIESGTVVVDVGELRFEDLQQYLDRNFRHVAEAKGVDFAVRVDERLPRSMVTDVKRLQQILKNLLSNAFKFTHRGEVTLTIEPVLADPGAESEDLGRAGQALAFAVADTGIGISADKQQIIFEAFQQADGSTSRKYGGTGLGLAISRELSKLLGGEIRLTSTPSKGSVFTLYLPQTYTPRAARPRAVQSDITTQAAEPIRARVVALQEALRLPATPDVVAPPAIAPDVEPERPANEAEDDREIIEPGDRVLLVVENDLAFARVLLDAAREKGFKGLVTSLGTGALSLVREFNPSAITLDIFLPDMNGWRVMSRLKHDLATRHVPICVISTDESRERALDAGAWGFLAKPIQSREVLEQALDRIQEFIARESRHLLLLMPNSADREEMVDALSGDDVRVFAVETAETALELLREQPIDCMVVGPDAPGLDPAALAAALEDRSPLGRLPLILCGEHADVYREELRHHLRDQATVCDVRSRARVLDQTAFFLHRAVERIPESEQAELRELHESNKVLAGKKVLIVDDDMRNIFALATVLDEQGMQIVSADNGREAIHHATIDPKIDVVLMDIMMPEMDGVTTIQEIRKIPERRDLPIIAVTAKAMKGDREKCIEAGAWDYLAKPVDTQDLLAALRAWLRR